MGSDTRQRLEQLLRTHLPGIGREDAFDELCPLADLGLTSLRSIDLVLDIEDELDIQFPDSMLVKETFESKSALFAAIDSLLGAGRP